MKRLFCLLTIALSTSLFASPVRDDLAAKNSSFIEDSVPQNLWIWPTEQTDMSASSSSIIVPRLNVWYGGCSNGGTFRRDQGPYCDFGEDYVEIHSAIYSQGCFLFLEPGRYQFHSLVDRARNGISFSFYKSVDGGFVYSHRASYYDKAEWKIDFSVPEECPLVLLTFIATVEPKTMTVTDIEIYRLD